MTAGEQLMARLAAASDGFVLPDILQPVDLFVELAGEAFRKRLFLTEGADGEALCLRPDFTIPVCLAHLEAGHDAPSVYHYRGNIFRKRRTVGSPEFEQAGTEWIGHQDEVAADADVFALAMECAGAIGLAPQIRVGDAHMFTALIEALALPPSWRERLRAAFGDTDRLTATLARLTATADGDSLAARLAPALAHVDAEQARAIVEAVVGLPSYPAAGRTPQDIASRIMEQVAGTGAKRDAAPLIRRYIEIEVPLAHAADALAAFAREAGVDLAAAIEEFARRTDALAARGVATDQVTFHAAFGRRLNYYTGFVFDMVRPEKPLAEVIAGGRYDRLMAILEPDKPLPAIGFSVWLDRIGEGAA